MRKERLCYQYLCLVTLKTKLGNGDCQQKRFSRMTDAKCGTSLWQSLAREASLKRKIKTQMNLGAK